VTRHDAGRTRTTALAASLVLALAAAGFADLTYASTVAAGAAPSDAPPTSSMDAPAGAPIARLSAATGVDGAAVDALSLGFASARRADPAPCVVWTGAADARIDFAGVAWSGEKAVVRPAAAAHDVGDASLATYVAEMAWTSSVVEQVPTLSGAPVAKPADFLAEAVSTPEPGAAALFALGAAGLGLVAWTRRRRVAR
jgi:hypothetical protein